MGIRFVLMVNKQGQTRLAQYYEYLTLEERRALEGEIVRKCLARTEQQVYPSPSPCTRFDVIFICMRVPKSIDRWLIYFI